MKGNITDKLKLRSNLCAHCTTYIIFKVTLISLLFAVDTFLHSELNNNRFEVSHVHKVECVVPWLNDTLVFFTISLQLCQQLKDKVGVSPGR